MFVVSASFADDGQKPGEYVAGPGPMRYDNSDLSASAINASEDLMDRAIPVVREALGIKVSALSSGLSSFGSLVTQVLFFGAAVEMDPDARTGREALQGVAASNETTGVRTGSAGHYARTQGFSPEEIAELGLR